MITKYGSTIKSTWRSYLKYTVTETSLSYKVTVTDIGAMLTGSTYVAEPRNNDDEFKCTLKVGSKVSKCTTPLSLWSNESYTDMFDSRDRTIEIKKGTSSQSIPLSFSVYAPAWIRTAKKSGEGIDCASATSTASVTLSVPVIAKPTVSLSAFRDTEVETTAEFTAVVSSFEGDIISSVTLTVNGTAYSLGNCTIDDFGTRTFTKIITDLPISKTKATLSAFGLGGSSDVYSTYLSSAFYTMDIGGKGKEIAFGCPATDEELPEYGLFRCAMDTMFERDIRTEGDLYTKDGKAATLNLLNKIVGTSYSVPITVTNGTFTNAGTTAFIVGTSLRIYLNCTANAAKSAGNISNEVMLTIKIPDQRIASLWSISTCGGSSGPNSQLQFGVSRDENGVAIVKVTLAALGQSLAKGGSINAYAAMPCTLNLDKL